MASHERAGVQAGAQRWQLRASKLEAAQGQLSAQLEIAPSEEHELDKADGARAKAAAELASDRAPQISAPASAAAHSKLDIGDAASGLANAVDIVDARGPLAIGAGVCEAAEEYSRELEVRRAELNCEPHEAAAPPLEGAADEVTQLKQARAGDIERLGHARRRRR
ncbi:unnamed protein product [Prorocentrum cordatum]|uniref:Uncharacterized protein n=1 Tax=Prorocentrum cordatum TaxID=2364126 RepID=A0ABN9R261_9DINO|nr:unnamed protein product [Polarella glacialis]